MCLRQPIRPSLARASRRCASHSARMPAHSHSAALRAHAPAPVSVRRCATPRPPCAGPSAGLCRRHGQNSPSRRALFDPPLTPSGGTVAAVPVILRGPSRVRYALRLPVPARNILSPRLIVPSPASCLLRPPGLPARVCIPRRRPRLDHPSQVPPPLAPARLRGPSGTPDRFACPARRSSHLGQLSGSGVRSCPGPCIASARHGQRRRHGPPRQGQAKPSRPEDFDSPPYPPPGGLVRSPFFIPPSCPPRGLRLPRRPTLPFLVALLGVLAGLVHPLLFLVWWPGPGWCSGVAGGAAHRGFSVLGFWMGYGVRVTGGGRNTRRAPGDFRPCLHRDYQGHRPSQGVYIPVTARPIRGRSRPREWRWDVLGRQGRGRIARTPAGWRLGRAGPVHGSRIADPQPAPLRHPPAAAPGREAPPCPHPGGQEPSWRRQAGIPARLPPFSPARFTQTG